MKFFDLSDVYGLIRATLDGKDDDEVDFPFRVSLFEQKIIEMSPDPPASILLVGRASILQMTPFPHNPVNIII